ncbi:MAG: hypothetical protein Udaeo2_20600 [Candidatus Udaeobacter sp.]|nr:MAG: hypothetical protein Udaeo2_20600 [Candidatus Udaeobacter sp.]
MVELLQLMHTKGASKRRRLGKRPIHAWAIRMLTALLTSTEFAHIRKTLRRSKHIVQFDGVWGYTAAERLRNLLGDGPTFIHSMGVQAVGGALGNRSTQRPGRVFEDGISRRVTAYFGFCQIQEDLGGDTNWMRAHYKFSAILRSLAMQHPAHRPGWPPSRYCSAYKTCARVAVSTKTGI